MTAYAELQAMTNFSFLEGASHPKELALTAAALGMRALAVTDRNTLAGVVQAHLAGREQGMRVVVGCRLDFADAPSLLVYPTDRAAYGRLSTILTIGKRRAPKGKCFLSRDDVSGLAAGLIALAVPPDQPDPGFAAELQAWRAVFRRRLHLAANHRYRGDDARRLAWLAGLARTERVPLVATNDVRMHGAHRRALADVLTCIREGRTVDDAGWRLADNAERHLKAPDEMARLFRDHPAAIARTVEIAEACTFQLTELRHEYPEEVAPGGSPQETLVRLTWQGAAGRYPGGVPAAVTEAIHHELELIAGRDFAPFFLTVHDIVAYARSRGILCQGRGSAANSAVCYCLGITELDPTRFDLLFERFLSTARGEPPDIDVDFEHERREEVIQYIYRKYGRDRAGIAATVVRYRTRRALREVGKALGLSADVVGRLAKSTWGWSTDGIDAERARSYGFDPTDPRLALALQLSGELIGFPRHLSQHVGGFVITRGPLAELSPIMNAAMEDRTTIEWDKDDIEALEILKVDVLGLGMLTCLHRAFDLIERHHGATYTLDTVPKEQEAVYAMLQKADSIGVFQVESRAQMNMLPRLKPKEFYDLVIQVAIVRPGPIQGGMVGPYLRRRHGKERIDYPPGLHEVLKKTLGVPMFQEQAMRIAIVGAGFTAKRADELRRAMASFQRQGEVHLYTEELVAGMVERGYAADFARRCADQLKGFGSYGFPESHAASFALLVYVSAWIKCVHPDVFACALLNSQPMGFYAPAQIVRDAVEHGIVVLPVDVNHSDWDCTLEGDRPGRKALRLGLRMVKGIGEDDVRGLALLRAAGYRDPYDVWRRAGVSPSVLERLARADAFRSVGLDRRAALWAVRALGPAPLPLFARLDDDAVTEPAVSLPDMALGEHVLMDYASLSLSLKAHPLALLRDGLPGVTTAGRLARTPDGTRVTVAGLVLVRQRPESSKGVIFVTLEDETGSINVVLMPDVFDAFRRAVLAARLLAATGRVENRDGIIHLLAERFVDLTGRLNDLTADRPPPVPAAAVAVAVTAAEHRAFPAGRNFH